MSWVQYKGAPNMAVALPPRALAYPKHVLKIIANIRFFWTKPPATDQPGHKDGLGVAAASVQLFGGRSSTRGGPRHPLEELAFRSELKGQSLRLRSQARRLWLEQRAFFGSRCWERPDP